MATHSSILAWESPWTEEPGGLQFGWSQSLEEEKENQNFGQVFSAWKVHKISV